MSGLRALGTLDDETKIARLDLRKTSFDYKISNKITILELGKRAFKW